MSAFQQSPLSPTTISLPLVTELFSRFFSRLLENESKYPVFLKEWEAFKSILTSKPLDMDSVYIHLATIQLNLEKAHSTAPTIHSSRADFPPTINILPVDKTVDSGHFDFRLPPRLNINTSPKARSSSEMKSRPSLPMNLNAGLKPSGFGLQAELPPRVPLSRKLADQNARRTSINVEMDFRGEIKMNSLAPSTFGDVADLSLIHSKSSDGFESYSDLRMDNQWLSNLDQAPKTKYDLGYLASKARRLTETVTSHSDKLVTNFEKAKVGVPGGYEFPEERTPLRRIVVYSAQSPKQTASNNVQNNIQDAMDQLATRLQSNPKVLPFNNALISY